MLEEKDGWTYFCSDFTHTLRVEPQEVTTVFVAGEDIGAGQLVVIRGGMAYHSYEGPPLVLNDVQLGDFDVMIPPPSEKICTCSTATLMTSGCKCGAIQREKE